MYNDSIETLLLRHYGQDGPTPEALEQRLISSVRQAAMTQQQEEEAKTRVLKHSMSRRHAMKRTFLSLRWGCSVGQDHGMDDFSHRSKLRWRP